MIDNFQQNRALFDRLVAMVNSDWEAGHRVTYVPPDDHSGSVTDLSESRVAEYQAIFGSIDVDRLHAYQSDGDVTFFTKHVSFDAFKTYEYMVEPPDTLYSSLDDIPVDFPPYGTAYRRLDDNWYIVYYSSSD